MRVLDTSAILRSRLDFSGGGFALTPGVLDEIQSEMPAAAVEGAVRAGAVKILSPSEESLREVAEAAKKTGDLDWLSRADLEALALALEKEYVIVTDDYGIQNVAAALGVKCEGVAQDGIKENYRWVKRCEGCGKIYPPGPQKSCEVCGAKLRKKRARE